MNLMSAPPQPKRPRLPTGGRLVAWVVIAQLVVVACVTGAHIMRDRAAAGLMAETRTVAEFRAGILQAEIDKYRALPSVLSRDEDLRQVLLSNDKALGQALSNKLQQIAAETAVDVLYVLNLQGFGVATGQNPPQPRMFCVLGCARRHYFSGALRDGSAQLFSLGRANQRPGLYLSHVIKSHAGANLGVVVAKVEFGPIQREWQAQGVPAMVTDEHGVVLISSNPRWLGYTVAPLDPALRERIKASRQFGAMPLDPLPMATQDALNGPMQLRADLGRGTGVETSVVASAPLDVPGWRLYLFKPVDSALNRAAVVGAAVVLLACVLLLSIATVVMRRYRRRQAVFQQEIAMRHELEERVAERTQALSASNTKLLNEMEGRRRMEGDLHRMQDELVQANKLAALGQIAAGVAHEVNQPLAAIRTYAASGRKFMRRGQIEEAEKNFSIIDDLTGRIKLITDELRAFARRTPREINTVSVDDAVAGALLLMKHRMHLEAVQLIRDDQTAGLQVMAERFRLEQVLVNLLQNALDALSGREDAAIELKIRAAGSKVLITLSDNGPGLSDEAKAALFMPFSTTKSHGLGLGLVICREIATELGGELVLNQTLRGASFTLSLNAPGAPRKQKKAALANS